MFIMSQPIIMIQDTSYPKICFHSTFFSSFFKILYIILDSLNVFFLVNSAWNLKVLVLYRKKISEMVFTCPNSCIQKEVMPILQSETKWEQFCRTPCSKKWHNSYLYICHLKVSRAGLGPWCLHLCKTW